MNISVPKINTISDYFLEYFFSRENPGLSMEIFLEAWYTGLVAFKSYIHL